MTTRVKSNRARARAESRAERLVKEVDLADAILRTPDLGDRLRQLADDVEQLQVSAVGQAARHTANEAAEHGEDVAAHSEVEWTPHPTPAPWLAPGRSPDEYRRTRSDAIAS